MARDDYRYSGEHYKTFYKNEYCTDVTIQQLSSGNDVVPGYSIKLVNAYPIQVGAIELSSEGDGLLEVSITWEYDNLEALD